jgi:3-oxoacyl-[acyl-carrier-protein] synthase III
VAPNITEVLALCGRTAESIDYFILHQANLLINESIRKKLRLPQEKVPISLDRFGNTSSASIPLTIVANLREQVTSKKLSFVLSGFGVGLSWGSVVAETDKIICPQLIEY